MFIFSIKKLQNIKTNTKPKRNFFLCAKNTIITRKMSGKTNTQGLNHQKVIKTITRIEGT